MRSETRIKALDITEQIEAFFANGGEDQLVAMLGAKGGEALV